MNALMQNDESKDMNYSDTKYRLEGVQAYVIHAKTWENEV